MVWLKSEGGGGEAARIMANVLVKAGIYFSTIAVNMNQIHPHSQLLASAVDKKI